MQIVLVYVRDPSLPESTDSQFRIHSSARPSIFFGSGFGVDILDLLNRSRIPAMLLLRFLLTRSRFRMLCILLIIKEKNKER